MRKVLDMTGREPSKEELGDDELHSVSITTLMKFGTTKDGIDVIKPQTTTLNTDEAGKELLNALANDENERSNLLVNLQISNAITSIRVASDKMIEDHWDVEEQANIFSKLVMMLVELPAMQAMEDVIRKREESIN